jgi:hypothetical protein
MTEREPVVRPFGNDAPLDEPHEVVSAAPAAGEGRGPGGEAEFAVDDEQVPPGSTGTIGSALGSTGTPPGMDSRRGGRGSATGAGAVSRPAGHESGG